MAFQPSIFDPPVYRARGPLLEPGDHVRLGRQLAAVLAVLKDGRWWSLRDLSYAAAAPEASVSARIRDLRRPECGGYTVERKRDGNTFRYRLVI